MENTKQPKDPNQFYTNVLTLADLQPGDILTFQGENDDAISRLIMMFTHSQVTHGAMYFQSTPVPALADAGANGIHAHKVNNKEGARYAFVSRLTKNEGLLKSGGTFTQKELEPVLSAARTYILEDIDYPFTDLALLAMILIYKDVSDAGIMQELIILLLEGITAKLKEALDKILHDGKHAMVCSSFVYQCYLDASKKNKDLKIKLNKDADLRLLKARPSNTLLDLYAEHAAEHKYNTKCIQISEQDQSNSLQKNSLPKNLSLEEIMQKILDTPQSNRVTLVSKNELCNAIESLLIVLAQIFDMPFKTIEELIKNAREQQSMFVTPNDLCFNIKNAQKVGKIQLDRFSENLEI